MSHTPDANAEVSLTPAEAWHCSHLYYRFDRGALQSLTPAELAAGREASFTLDPAASTAGPACRSRSPVGTRPISA